MSSRKVLLVLFFVNALVHLLAQLLDVSLLGTITKPLIIPLLFGHYMVSVTWRSTPLMIALIACWIGDVALMFVSEGQMWFMVGLGSFLVGHVFYIITYRQFRSESSAYELLPVQKIRFSLPVVLAGTGLIVILYPVLGGLKFPVIVYATAIMVMVMNGIFRFGRTTSRSFWMVLSGALLFMTSDSILAINKFLGAVQMGGLLIMLTYIAAQYFIIEGLRQHES